MRDHASGKPSRRGFLRAAGLGGTAAFVAPALSVVAGACGPVTTPGALPAPAAGSQVPSWEVEWQKLVEAAKKEGKIAFNITNSAENHREVVEAFKAAFPGIEVEFTTFTSGSLWLPRVIQEQKAGIYTWDVTRLATAFAIASARPDGVLAPIRPAIVRPDVLEDKNWIGGFDACFVDKEKQWGFGMAWDLSGVIWINTDLVREDELKNVNDLLQPKWKGRMIFADPPTSGFSWVPLTFVRLNMGEQLIKRLIVDQEPTLSKDTRQITEALVRGRFAMGFGVSEVILDEFHAQGVGRNVKKVFLPEASGPNIGQPLWLVNNAPHPNSAKVFINWFLGPEGQAVHTRTARVNSRRPDVAPGNPATNPDPNKAYKYILGAENTIADTIKTQEIAKQLLSG